MVDLKVRANEGVGKMLGNGEIRFGANDDNVDRIGIESSAASNGSGDFAVRRWKKSDAGRGLMDIGEVGFMLGDGEGEGD